ncbi:MAG: 4-hydroxy-tetrahydrodipicolinate synthase [Muribaculaceae bacterium]|nr:4-hydroxy-tetrahydrodipicolinate synthase [Muribaculaceae bacterium]
MTENRLTGLGVALVTPFKEDYSIDFDALENLIEHVIDGGTDYIVVLGTTAETPTLNKEEKQAVISFVREKNAGRLPLVLGIGGNNTASVVNEIKETDKSGFLAILSVTPYYNKPSQEGLYRHYKAIAEASKLPIILYNVPKRTGVNLTPETTVRLAKEFSNICGIKEASGNLVQVKEIIEKAPSNFLVISGDDGLTCDFMKLGAHGLISVLANAFPAKISELMRQCEACKFEYAEYLQKSLAPLTSCIFEDGNPCGIKYALSHLHIAKNILRLPLVAVSKEVEYKIKKAAQELFSLE